MIIIEVFCPSPIPATLLSYHGILSNDVLFDGNTACSEDFRVPAEAQSEYFPNSYSIVLVSDLSCQYI